MNITPSAEQKINQTLADSEYLRVEVNGWLQRLYGWLGENEWSGKERHLAEQVCSYRLHLGGVLIKGNAGLD